MVARHATRTASEAHEHTSRWPLLVALGATLLLVGVLKLWIGVFGGAILLWAITRWVNEDLRYGTPPRSLDVRSDRWWAVFFLLLGEVVLFGTLFTFYFWARGYATQWPPPEIPPFDLTLVTLNTAVLLASGWAAHKAHKALEKGHVGRFRTRLAVAILLGFVFLGGQAYEYVTAGFTPQTGSYGTAFFALTGVHGFHVLVGLIVLSTFWALSKSGRLGRPNASGVGGGILYWHFVDVVWLVLYSIIYLRVV